MPLRAYIDGEETISIDLSDEQWNVLKKRLKGKEAVLKLACCGQEGFLRTSSKGLKHFVHAKAAIPCDWKPESAEHLKAKIAIIEACRENGWDAVPEFAEADWRADVLASQNGKRIAFEVQWSRQTYEETKIRQNRYKESNVRGCWFFRTVPKEMADYDKNLIADKAIPAFKIFKDEDSNITAQLGQEQMPLKMLVDSLLNRKLKFCEHARLKSKQNVTIVFFEYTCWKCHKPQHCYTVIPELKSVCDRNIRKMESMWDGDSLDKHSQVYEAVQRFLKTDKGKNLKIGQLKTRYSNTVQSYYPSFGCYDCDAIFGDFYLQTEKMYACENPDNIKITAVVEFDTITEEDPHWCFSESRDFCE